MAAPTSVFAGLSQDSTLTGGTLRGVTGPLVKVPILAGNQYTTTLAGSGSANFVNSALMSNPDGSTNNLQLNAPAGPPNSAGINTILSGRTIGIRWRRDSIATPFFDLVIDGVAYPVDDTNARGDNQPLGVTDYEGSYLVDGLADRRHSVSVIVAADKVGGASRTLNVMGFIAERGRGYNELASIPRFGMVSSATLIPAASAVIINATVPVAGITLRNTDATAPHTVAIYGPDGTTIWRKYTLAAASATATTSDTGADITIPFPTPRNLYGWKWVTDTASKVAGYVEYA